MVEPRRELTGHPTVVGWDHQQGYRGVGAFERRAQRVDRVYAGPWPAAAAVLRSHGMDYVYVGPNEREAYGDDLRSFDRPALSVAFENGAVTIYAVDRSALPANATVGTDTDANDAGATATVEANGAARASAGRA